MRRLSPQQVAMLQRIADGQHAIPHGWTGNRRLGAERTRHSLRHDDLICARTPPSLSAPYDLTEKGRAALAQVTARAGGPPPSGGPSGA